MRRLNPLRRKWWVAKHFIDDSLEIIPTRLPWVLRINHHVVAGPFDREIFAVSYVREHGVSRRRRERKAH